MKNSKGFDFSAQQELKLVRLDIKPNKKYSTSHTYLINKSIINPNKTPKKDKST